MNNTYCASFLTADLHKGIFSEIPVAT